MATQFLNRKVYYRDDIIFREGDPGDCAYLIERGEILITKKTPDGDELELGRLGPGAIFGEMAMIDMQPRMAKATAMIDTTLTFVNHQMFEKKMQAADPFLHALLLILVRNVRSVSAQLIAGGHH
jgi:CRP/FNR family cyclic AMP-dependent transcriptional regulator